jgi:Molecular chaperone GrpE (heat shock protein)
MKSDNMFFKKRNMSSDKNYNDKNYEPENLGEAAETIDVDPSEEVRPEGAEVATDEEISEIETLKNLLQAKETEVEKEKKEYLFLMAEFDNFRKRTIRERSELVKNASEKALQGLLPIVDDFERGLDAIRDSSDAEAVKEGMNLIYNKLIKYLADNGVKAMESTGADFDTELHEAVAMVPADDVTPKGKVKDTVSKGYTINDKVLRHAKVVVAQ